MTRMPQELFSSWLEAEDAEEDPTWRQRALVIALFAAGGLIGGALSALLPGVDFRLSHLWRASLSATLAALPLAGSLFRAGRRGDLRGVTLLCLLLTALGYLAFALVMTVLDALLDPSTAWHDPGRFGLALFITWGVLVYTWKVYVPCAVVTGWTLSLLLRRMRF